jgi:hypothetical protein
MNCSILALIIAISEGHRKERLAVVEDVDGIHVCLISMSTFGKYNAYLLVFILSFILL